MRSFEFLESSRPLKSINDCSLLISSWYDATASCGGPPVEALLGKGQHPQRLPELRDGHALGVVEPAFGASVCVARLATRLNRPFVAFGSGAATNAASAGPP